MKKAELMRLFRLGEGTMQGKKLLDYGGGSGIAFQAGRELGCDVFYYDVDDRAVSFVRGQFGLEIDRLIERPSDLEKHRFDLILSDNVLEHAPSPLSMIRMLLDALEVEGTLVLKTPHARTSDLFFCPKVILGGYLAKARKHNSLATTFSALFWNRFWTCDPPRHLFSFSRKSVIEIMRRLEIGQECYAISYYHVPLFEYSLTKTFLQRPKTLLGIVRRLLSLPLLLIELVSKLIQVSLRVLQITSPGGIVLRVDKRPNGNPTARASN
jgi:SAM-dependent methyltransferase